MGFAIANKQLFYKKLLETGFNGGTSYNILVFVY
jgi:hypothetical protein